MNIIALIGIGLLAVIAFLGRTVIRAEYGWWGPRVAERIVSLASAVAARPGQRDEWLGELSEHQKQGVPGVLFALQLVKGGVRMRAHHIRMKHRRAGLFDDCWYLYLGVLQLANLLNDAVSTIRSLAQHDYTSAVLSFSILTISAPLVIWTMRSSLRGIDVKWVVACLLTGPTREQLDACLWTHGEQTALAAYETAVDDFNEGTPWAWAQRPLTVYRMGNLFNNRLFEWRARRTARQTEQSATQLQ
jgi:hypothetical protein